MLRSRLFLIACVWALTTTLRVPLCPAQTLPQLAPEVLTLNNLEAFSSVPQNWRIVGDAWVEPDFDGPLRTAGGDGILAFRGVHEEGDLVTSWIHGDLDLELEVMLGPGGESGVLLQGRYEVQLADSRAVQSPQFAHMGGIDAVRPDANGAFRDRLQGLPPHTNAARAPGLWQHLQVRFRAPRFDDTGRKTSNARFLEVRLNGVVVQQDAEVSAPTRRAIALDESPEGPLVLQAAAGSGAFRSIRYKKYGHPAPALQDIRYAVYEGEFQRLADVEGAEPVRTGTTERIGLDMVGRVNDFAVSYEAVFPAPHEGTYLFGLVCEGGCRLEVGDQLVLGPDEAGNGWHMESAETNLGEGDHPVRLTYYKSHRWWRPRLALTVEGPGFEQTPLQEVVPGRGRTTHPIVLRPDGAPRLLRSFMQHDGEKRTHVISVGSPDGTHYSYDLENGALLRVWRGDFLDVTQMWHERGEPQIALPLGATVELPRAPLIVRGDEGGPTSEAMTLVFAGFELNEAGYPAFTHRAGDLSISDQLTPAHSATDLIRTIRNTGPGEPVDAWLRVAAAQDIRPLGEATYVIGDFEYYVVLHAMAGDAVVVRRKDGLQELMLPFPGAGSEVSYILRW